MIDWKEVCAKCADGEIEPKFCEYYGEPNGCNSPKYNEHPQTNTGNAAAMREALVSCMDYFQRIDHPMNDYMRGLFETAYNKTKAALSAPRLNCEVGTAEEQIDLYGEFCQRECLSCDKRISCHIRGEAYRMKCMMEWSHMPYEADAAKEGGAE